MINDFLVFVKRIGNTLDNKYIYEFMFSTAPDVVWGDNFNIIPAAIIPNLTPEKNCLSKKGRIITDINFNLACESSCFSMMDSIDGILSLCFTQTDTYQNIHFDFGDEFSIVLDKLNKLNIEINNLEDIIIDDNNIVNSLIEDLENSIEEE